MAADCARLRQLITRAEARYLRRRAATEWFWAYCRKKWNGQPRLTSKVPLSFKRAVPELWRSPRRHSHILYEDCQALEDEAFMLVNRLLAQQKRGGEVDINQTKDQ